MLKYDENDRCDFNRIAENIAKYKASPQNNMGIPLNLQMSINPLLV